MTSLRLALGGGWIETAACAHAFPESFALFWRHAIPALAHAIDDAIGDATADMRLMAAAESESAEQDPAERQHSKRLPEGQLTPTEEGRQQPIPQEPHDFAADERE